MSEACPKLASFATPSLHAREPWPRSDATRGSAARFDAAATTDMMLMRRREAIYFAYQAGTTIVESEIETWIHLDLQILTHF